MNFGEQLRFHRKKLGLTQHELAKIIGITNTLISHYESNNRSIPSGFVFKCGEIFSLDSIGMEELKQSADFLKLRRAAERIMPDDWQTDLKWVRLYSVLCE